MKEYCSDDKACRHSLLLAYFGEHFAAGRCGNRCDNCLGPNAADDDMWQVCIVPCLLDSGKGEATEICLRQNFVKRARHASFFAAMLSVPAV
jgi:hypothetical protein